MAATVEDAVASVEHSAGRFTSLLRAGLDSHQTVRGSAWTIGQLGAHLASGAFAYEEIVAGNVSPYLDLGERAATNQARLETESGRDLRTLADTIDQSVENILAAVRGRPADAVVRWHQGIPMTMRPFLGAMVGEFAFHGQDLARTVGVPWSIERHDAFPVVDFFAVVTPHILERKTTERLSAAVEVRVRGYDTATYRFEHATLTVTPGRGERPDVALSLDPIAFLQLGYKRSGLTKCIVTGRAVAWGRRPWIALEFPGFFQSP